MSGMLRLLFFCLPTSNLFVLILKTQPANRALSETVDRQLFMSLDGSAIVRIAKLAELERPIQIISQHETRRKGNNLGQVILNVDEVADELKHFSAV